MSKETRRQDHTRYMTHKGRRYSYVYRGILVDVRSGYAHPRQKDQQVVIHCPDIERYTKSTSGVRRFIDKFLSTYNPQPNDYPF